MTLLFGGSFRMSTPGCAKTRVHVAIADRHLEHYLDCLVRLEDGRVAPELARRARGQTSLIRGRSYADASASLGDGSALDQLAEEIGSGKTEITEGISDVLDVLRNAGRPSCDRALDAVGLPGHPLHAAAIAELRKDGGHHMMGLVSHPLSLRLLRRELDSREPDGRRFYIVKDCYFMTRSGPSGSSSSRLRWTGRVAGSTASWVPTSSGRRTRPNSPR